MNTIYHDNLTSLPPVRKRSKTIQDFDLKNDSTGDRRKWRGGDLELWKKRQIAIGNVKMLNRKVWYGYGDETVLNPKEVNKILSDYNEPKHSNVENESRNWEVS